MKGIKLTNSRLEKENGELQAAMDAKDIEHRNLLLKQKKEQMKMEHKMIHTRHEVRKLESDNEKLRQTLKQKLNQNYKTSANANQIMAQPGALSLH